MALYPALVLSVRLFTLALARLADALGGDDLLALGAAEDGDTLRGAAGDADIGDGTADHLSLIGDEHDLVRVLDRKKPHDIAVSLRGVDRDDTLPAPAGDAVFISRAALAEAALRHRE